MRIRLSAQYSPQTRTERKNMSYIDELGKKAKSAAKNSAMLSQSLKNDILATIAAMLENGRDEIKKANELDITAAHENNMAASMVDIGVHQDGLVHISELSDSRFVKHPLDVVSVGDIVDVKVMSVDLEKKRIQLTMKMKG